MKRSILVSLLSISLAGIPALVGCERELAHEKQVEQTPNGTTVKEAPTGDGTAPRFLALFRCKSKLTRDFPFEQRERKTVGTHPDHHHHDHCGDDLCSTVSGCPRGLQYGSQSVRLHCKQHFRAH